MSSKIKYTFSGHESFFCKALWLKKGYDFVKTGKHFTEDSAVVDLGVGKNMVTSIKYWMRAFGMLEDDKPTKLADLILDTEDGYDPFLEDLGTVWLLHYLLVSNRVASIYYLLFCNFIKERNSSFTREQIDFFIKRKCDETGNTLLYNPNTVKRDIGVLIQNYVSPTNTQTNEDYSALLLSLNLIKQGEEKTYYFNYSAKSKVVQSIFLYAILDKKSSNVVAFDVLMDLATIFCMTKTELVDMLTSVSKQYPDSIQYSDNSGIRQLLFLHPFDKDEVLKNYYTKA